MFNQSLLNKVLSATVGVGLALATSVSAQTATTEPVGFIQNTFAPSPNGSTRVFTPFSVPLHSADVFAGAVSSVSANVVTLNTTSLSLGAGPYLMHVRSAANAVATGRTYLVTASTASTITVSISGYTAASVLASNDLVSIRPANTLATIFGSTDATVKLKTGDTASNADVVYIFNGTTYDPYYFYVGNYWVKDTDPNYNNANNSVIFPDEGVLVGRISTATLPATYATTLGTVPTNAQKENILAPGFSLISNPLPTAANLVSLGFLNSPGWTTSDTAGSADNVLLFINGAWVTFYYYTGNYWVRDDDANYNTQNAYPIPAGTAMLVRRRTASTATNAYIATPLNYTLN